MLKSFKRQCDESSSSNNSIHSAMPTTNNCKLNWAYLAFLIALNVMREELPDESQQTEARWWSQNGSGLSGIEQQNSQQGRSLGNPSILSNSSSVLTILRPLQRPQLHGFSPFSPAEMGATIPSLRRFGDSTTWRLSPKCIDTTLLTRSRTSSQLSLIASQMPSLPTMTASIDAATAWKGVNSPTLCATSRTKTPSPHLSDSSLAETIETLLMSPLSIMKHLFSERGVSPPFLIVPWI